MCSCCTSFGNCVYYLCSWMLSNIHTQILYKAFCASSNELNSRLMKVYNTYCTFPKNLPSPHQSNRLHTQQFTIFQIYFTLNAAAPVIPLLAALAQSTYNPKCVRASETMRCRQLQVNWHGFYLFYE